LKPNIAKPTERDALRPSTAAPVTVRAAIAAVGAYLALFLALPIGELGGSRRGELLLVALLRPDDLLGRWLEGISWKSFAERGWVLLFVLGILSVAMSAGWLWLRLLRVDRALTKLEMTLLAGVVGLNLVSLATFLFGLAGWQRANLFFLIGAVVCTAAAGMRWLRGCESGSCLLGPDFARRSTGIWNWNANWLWLLAPFALAIVGSAMLPPLDFDVREYHLQAPKEFYQAGRITFLDHNVYANMPLGTEMFALAGMIMSGDFWTGALVGKTLIALFAPLTALLLYAFGCRFVSPAAGILAALVYISIPWVAIVSAHGLVEGAFACYLIASVYLAFVWRDGLRSPAASALPTTTGGLLLTAGFLAGAAVATKYPAVVYCAIPLVIFVVKVAVENGGWQRVIKPLAVIILGMAVGCGLWFAKNAVYTGNPTYPLLYRVFGGETRTPEKEMQWQQAHRPPNFEPADFANRVWNVALASAWISPLVVPLAGFAACVRSQRRLSLLLAALAFFIFATWWLLTHRIDRFLTPIWPLAAMLAGIGATWEPGRLWRRALWCFLAIGLAFNFVLVAGGAVSDNRFLIPLDRARAESVVLVDPWHAWLNEHRKEVQRVLLVGDAQPFDLEVPATYNTVFDDSIFERLARDRSPAEVRKALTDRGISHVYVAWPEIERYRSPGNYGITEFLQPAVFDRLAEARVLERLPMLAGSRGEMYRVIAQ
jgi:4-amino-4-deoxy-L-arabinose transferase-like glycosyltransferase